VKTMLMAVAMILGTAASSVSAQEDPSPIPYSRQEDPPRGLERERQPELRSTPEDRSQDLWYGVPGVRPGGDLLGPILELIRKPSGLLDFRPRQIPSYLPDRETAECFRERR
jgi:hypothetical protein